MNRLQLIKEYCKNKKVLDVGCVAIRLDYDNKYWLHGNIVEAARTVKGIDINKQGIEELKGRGFDVEHKDAEKFSMSEEYDVIVSAEIIEHLSNPGNFLQCAKECLTENGKLIITTPNIYSLFKLGVYFTPLFGEKYHTVGFTKELLKNLLEKEGFSIDEMFLTDHETVPRRMNRIVNLLVPPFLKYTLFCVASPD